MSLSFLDCLRADRPTGGTVARRWLSAALILSGAALALPASADDFLEPDQAFHLSARVADGATVELRYEIAPGYYMYRERLAFESAPSGAVLGAPHIPTGITKFDETFQKNVEIYHDTLVLAVPVTAAPADFKLGVTGQGCAEKGLCYPPRTQYLKVHAEGGAIRQVTLLPDEEGAAWQPADASVSPLQAVATAPAAKAAAAAGAGQGPGESAGIESALRSGSLWSVAGVFLLAGLLLSFTPCVLPMVPILSSIIVGQGEQVSRGRGFLLSVTYALGMALVYTVFGVAAGLAGEGLAAALQNAWVLGAFALLLVGLSLSMFGFYELQVPGSLQSRLTDTSNRLQGGRFVGVFVMGGISALIVGPCVAAPLAGALVYISQTRDVLIGGVALFALACGMSVPLLLVGLSAGELLPHAGVWMESVKRFFGALLIGVAIWMVSPVLPAWAVMLLWGVFLLVSATYLRVFDPLSDHAKGWARFFKGVGVMAALIGVAQVAGALSGGRDVLQPLAHLGGKVSAAGPAGAGAAEHVSFRRVRNVAELDAAVAAAGRPVMLDFYADWCVSCKEMEQLTFPEARVRAKLAGALLLQADVTANSADDKALLKRFQLFGPPGLIFFDAQGRELSGARVIGFQNADRFLQSLAGIGL
ncbi:MAG: protein-disulfide reductase DsbD [Leptothrix sp. (in: b-proteobacteria)]